jgi:hypothetical protein
LPGSVWHWFFERPAAGDSPESIIVWWEIRRIPYNVIVGITGLISFILFLVFILASGELSPGEDAIEPIALLAAPLLVVPINMAYTLGWLTELGLRHFDIRVSGPLLMKMGVGLSLLTVASPALYWGVALAVIKAGALR